MENKMDMIVTTALENLHKQFHILRSDNFKLVDSGVQVDMKDEYSMINKNHSSDKATTLSEELLEQLGVAPLAPTNQFIPGIDFPFQIRAQMTTFPHTLRIPPIAWTCTCILNIYIDKIFQDYERSSKGLRKLAMPDHLYDYFVRTTGLKTTADVQISQLLRACEAHHRRYSTLLSL